MGTNVVKSEHGTTVLDDQSELVIQMHDKLKDLIEGEAGEGLVALDIAARFEHAVISTLQAHGIKPRQHQHLYSVALRQFLTDPKSKPSE